MDISKFLVKLFGDKKSRDLKAYRPLVEMVTKAYPAVQALSHDELRARTAAIKKQIADSALDLKKEIQELKDKVKVTDIQDRAPLFAQIDKLEKEVLERYEEVLNEVRPEVFAIVKSTAERFTNNETIEVTATDFDRTLAARFDFVEIQDDKAIYSNHWIAGGNDMKWAMVHFDVQLFGGTVLHQGKIAEMFTGEGKTLTATLPVFLNALTGKGVHVVTVNEYLAKRDSEWMGKVHRFLGLTVGVIYSGMDENARRRAYNSDITYATNNELGFDYLRDNMVIHGSRRVQRGHNFAVVDEVDSILIDEARTPLIISGGGMKSSDMYYTAQKFVSTLKDEEDYHIELKEKRIHLTEEGTNKAERYFKVDNLSFRDELGYTEKFPKWAIAYKFKADERTTTLEDVVWQVSRSAKLNPLAILDPVDIGGVTVKRATLNNYGDILRKNVKIGDRVFIRRSNDVIPEIMGVAETYEHSKTIERPTVCPACGAPVQEVGAFLYCTGEHCAPQVISMLDHFASKDAMEGISKILTKEARADHINVCSVYPGGVDTNFRAVANHNYLKPETVAKMIKNCMEVEEGCVHDIVIRPFIEDNMP